MHSNWGEVLAGGAGDDRYTLWQPGATVKENAGEGIDTVYIQFGGGYTLTDNVENLVLSSSWATWATGNAMDNIIVAGVTSARLNGGAGNDVLVGGAGADVFVVEKGNGSDAIMNYQAGWDSIQLSGYGFTNWADLSSHMRQTGSDVTVDLGNTETLVIRNVALSDLGPTDFGFALTSTTPAKMGFATLANAANVQFANGWSALNNAWGSTKLVEGRDYTLSSVVNPDDLTAGTSFTWSYPAVTGKNWPVLAYPAVSYGTSPFSTAKAGDSKLFPLKVGDIKSMTADYDVSFGGQTSGFNVAFDIWFTSKPNGGSTNVSNELMIWVHKGVMDPSGSVVGTYNDGTFSATIWHKDGYTALVADHDVPASSINLAGIMAKLTDMGILGSNEYLSYLELGSEVSSGSGKLTVNNLDLNITQAQRDGTSATYAVTGAGVALVPPPPPPESYMVTAGVDAARTIVGDTCHDMLTLDYCKAGKGISLDLANGSGQIDALSGTISYDKIKAFTVTGTSFDDVLNGGDGNDHLIGGAGNDILRGGLGTNILDGGDGDDSYFISSSTDTVIDSSGNDTATVYADWKIASGIETVILGQAGLTVTSGDDAHSIWGSNGADTVYGGGGNDTIGGKDGNDTLYGGAGDDTIYGDGGNDTLYGDAGNDSLYGGDGNDVLYGGDGNDTLSGGGGNNILNGGAGDDRYIIQNSNDVVIDSSGNDVATVFVDWKIANGIETVVLCKGGLTITSGDDAHTIWGSSGADTVYGGGGNDTIGGKDGNDTLYGGTGDDTIYGDGGNDLIFGDAGNDTLYGGDGNDVIYGGDGNDLLGGGTGNNILNGGAGDDRYVIQSSTDIVIDSSGNDTATVYVDWKVADGIETVILAKSGLTITSGSDAHTIWGTSGTDTVYGGGGNDVIYGGDGNDALYGGDGDDILNGGAGNDLMVGGNGNDRYFVSDAGDQVVEAAGGGTDTVTATIDYTLTANVENLILQSTAGLKGTGNNLANSIFGDVGADKLYGMDGNDVLTGRGGADDLYGGSGADIFRYESVSDSTATARDRIMDFNYAEGDRINLTAIDAKTSTAADDAFTWIGTAGFTHTAGELRYSVSGTDAIIEGDVNGDGVADLSILVKNVTSLHAGMFQL